MQDDKDLQEPADDVELPTCYARGRVPLNTLPSLVWLWFEEKTAIEVNSYSAPQRQIVS